MNWTSVKRGWWNIILFNMIQVDRNVYTMFNFFHECKSSPPHHLRGARTLVGKLAVTSKQCPGMWGLGWNIHLWYRNWNVWYTYTQLEKISARYCLRPMELVLWKVALSGRMKLLLSLFNPLINVPALFPVFEDNDSHWLASPDIGILKLYSMWCLSPQL